MCFGMKAGDTEFRRLFAGVEIAAVATAPDNLAITGKNPPGFNICQKVTVALFMLLFGDGNGIPDSSYGREPLFQRYRSKTGIQL